MVKSAMNSVSSNKSNLKSSRRDLRNNSTSAEARLWLILQNKQLDGRKFRRQHSLGNYILDFYCPRERLAIELDGEVHNDPSRRDYDETRELWLQKQGISVLRFENKTIFEHPEGVVDEIKRHFRNIE